jgi:hypothetical protein
MNEGSIVKYGGREFKLIKSIKMQGYKQTWLASFSEQNLPKQVVLKFTDIYPRD